jgi:hypothetical protein
MQQQCNSKYKRQHQIPKFDFAQGRLFGDDNQKEQANSNYKCNSEMRGFLHSATHKSVNGFGRNDASRGDGRKDNSRSLRDDNKKAKEAKST